MSAPKTVFESRRFRVERRTVRIDGRAHEFEYLRHPGAAVILPILDDGRVVLIHNQRVAVGRELLEVPAGTLESGEEPVACAARELAEETGYRAGKLTPLCAFYSSPGILTEQMHLFLATRLAPGPAERDAGEQIRLAELSLDEALAGVRDGRIADGKTMVALLYYQQFVRAGT